MEEEITLDELLQLIIQDKGGTPQEYKDLMEYIAYHETGPVAPGLPDQRMDPKARQYTYDEKLKKYVQDGYGRGLFMYEAGEGRSANSAVNRLYRYLTQVKNVDAPKWVESLQGLNKNVDVSKLSADQQKMLFLADHRMRERSNFSELWDGTKDRSTWWADYHWTGEAEDYNKKLKAFTLSEAALDSVKALKKKREELELKKNMAPFLSDSNNVDNVVKESYFKRLMDSMMGIRSAIVDSMSKDR